MRYDWNKIGREYTTGNCSLEELAEKHKVSFSTMMKQSAKSGWAQKREEYRQNKGRRLDEAALKMAENRAEKAEKAIEDALMMLLDGIKSDVEHCKSLKDRQICMSNIKTAQEVLQNKKSFPHKLNELEAKIKKLSAEADALDKAKDVMGDKIKVEWVNGEWMDDSKTTDAES